MVHEYITVLTNRFGSGYYRYMVINNSSSQEVKGLSIALGIILGITVGIMSGKLILGLPIGLGVGLLLGMALDGQKKAGKSKKKK